MKRSIKIAVAAAVALTATSAFATNGDNLIGLGAKSLGMGGTGTAHYNGSESATSNPALITKGKGLQFTFGGTYFTPEVKIKTDSTAATANGSNQLSEESDAKHNVIPYIALTNNFDNGVALGLSMFGSAGMGTDWRNSTYEDAFLGAGNTPNLYSMRSNLLLLKFSVPVAYSQENWSVGIAPVMMYGSLDMAFQTQATDNTGTAIAGIKDVGRGSSSDFGLGYEAGAAYTLKDMGVTVAARYQSPISMEYKDQISVAGAAFGFGAGAVPNFSDKLEQPAEYGFGIDWTSGDFSLTADYKKIKWGSADGYKDFGWENQNVYAIGAEYRIDKLALRAGYNYGKNPIKNNTDQRGVISGTAPSNPSNPAVGPAVGDLVNALNHVMFPAVTEKHYTVGFGYQFTKNVGADLAFMYATSPDVKVNAGDVGLGNLTVTNDQMALAANLNVAF